MGGGRQQQRGDRWLGRRRCVQWLLLFGRAGALPGQASSSGHPSLALPDLNSKPASRRHTHALPSHCWQLHGRPASDAALPAVPLP